MRSHYYEQEKLRAGVNPGKDARDAALTIDLDSIEVHRVEGVTFKTTPHKVRTLVSEKRESKFAADF